jgi:ABC-type Fe3+/spermidine/putrescine transport system ATPase subunit
MAIRVTVDRVCKSFGATKVLMQLSLDVRPGSLTFLLGPSGCGKTTLLRIIAGLTDATTGSVRFGDRDVTNLSPRQREIGMVFQSYALWPHMSVRQNVEFGLKARKIDPESRPGRVSAILDAVGLLEHADKKPGQMSGGQQQRVALARALVVKPQLLLLDEPLSNLDAGLRIQLRELIRDLVKDAGITSIYVTHDQDEAMAVADEIVIMQQGHILQHGAPREVYNKPASVDVATFMGEINLIEGTLYRANGTAELQTSLGTLNASEAPGALGSLSSATIAIRPESLHISKRAPAGANSFAGSVRSTSRRGLWSRHIVDLEGGAELIALEPGLGTLGPGDHCSLTVDPEDVIVLPRQAGGA